MKTLTPSFDGTLAEVGYNIGPIYSTPADRTARVIAEDAEELRKRIAALTPELAAQRRVALARSGAGAVKPAIMISMDPELREGELAEEIAGW